MPDLFTQSLKRELGELEVKQLQLKAAEQLRSSGKRNSSKGVSLGSGQALREARHRWIKPPHLRGGGVFCAVPPCRVDNLRPCSLVLWSMAQERAPPAKDERGRLPPELRAKIERREAARAERARCAVAVRGS